MAGVEALNEQVIVDIKFKVSRVISRRMESCFFSISVSCGNIILIHKRAFVRRHAMLFAILCGERKFGTSREGL